MSIEKKEILILGNPPDHEGGMVEFNKGLINFINRNDNQFSLVHMTIGSRMSLFYKPIIKRILYPLYYLFDLGHLLYKLNKEKQIKIIQVNPSLIPVPLIRDGVLLALNRFSFRKRSIMVIHGWKDHYYYRTKQNRILRKVFLRTIGLSDIIFVLAKEFKDKLVVLGVEENKIRVTSTFFLRENLKDLAQKRNYGNIINFIFLGRISRLKGIDELISACIKYHAYNNNFTCLLVGHEVEVGLIANYKAKIELHGLNQKIQFLGRITGPDKFKLLTDSDVFVFPSYTEGCPTSVIEALSVGLFVISTKVGALVEIIDENNGFLINSGCVEELYQAMVTATERITTIRDRKSDISRNAFLKYEVENISNEFINAYETLLM